MKYSEYFDLEELVPQAIYTQFGARASQFLDYRAGALLDRIRELAGVPVTINNWDQLPSKRINGHRYEDSGFRVPNEPTGGFLSQHKFGRGFDLKIILGGKIKSYEDFRNLIRENFTELNELGLTTIELGTPTWLHIDMRFTGINYLYEVPYK